MLSHPGGDHWMRELHQQRTAASHQQCHLTVDAPKLAVRRKKALACRASFQNRHENSLDSGKCRDNTICVRRSTYFTFARFKPASRFLQNQPRAACMSSGRIRRDAKPWSEAKARRASRYAMKKNGSRMAIRKDHVKLCGVVGCVSSPCRVSRSIAPPYGSRRERNQFGGLLDFFHQTPVHQLTQRHVFSHLQPLFGELNIEQNPFIRDHAVVGERVERGVIGFGRLRRSNA